MMSLRTLARSAPRAFSRASSAAIYRSSASVSFLTKTSSPFASALRTARQPAAFSTSALRRSAAGEIERDLAAKLESEIEFESQVKESEEEPASIKDFLENGPFEIKDIPGQEKVVLTRNYGNETITVTFSIADLAAFDQEQPMYEEDPALAEEGEEGESKQQQSQDMLEEGGEEEFDQPHDSALTCNLTVVVEKPNSGALEIEAVAHNGQIAVSNVFYHKEAAQAHAESAEIEHKAQDVYPGPSFGTLDEQLQLQLEQYLEERGINTTLAVFVPDYMDVKEQREYLAWLKNIKGFIEA
ncbi:hypothetical protein MAPG_03827 [Magnaporthiopsis poae ATCC 64411]|uniref:Regulatory protein suaprga1 n=1 Tax=Magnaporthiopsis poae (strain ATCC 64411 / 73-15) TaxID=644358 RepID=A0A0C4DV27_MAGP6|nr:hypothetical protein MAPG_03827 [Magnaporthiopsis poae ATCC 64411]